jgi:hypothetical protein
MSRKPSISTATGDQYIIDHYKTDGAEAVAKAIGLTKKQVTQRAWKLGQCKKNNCKPRQPKPPKVKPAKPVPPRIEVKGARTIHYCL